MSRRVNITNYLITMAITLGTLFVAIYTCNTNYGGTMFEAGLKFLVGAIVAGFVHALVHELGHLLSGKRNGFAFSEMVVWFLCWTKVKRRTVFKFVMIGEEAGYTQMIPTHTDNIEKRLKNMTKGGMIASFIFMLFGIPALFLTFLPVWVYVIWVMFLPIGAYYFFGSALPTSSLGVRNDGAVIYGLKRKDAQAKVTVNLLKIQAEMYNGKRPSEIDKELYFNLPQLPEDDPTFTMLLNARYYYYLDAKDYENAKAITKRLLSLEEYLPKGYINLVKTDALYDACTFNCDEDVADDLVYELEKYLNNVNSVTNVRVKLAYLVYIKGERDNLDMFFKKAFKEVDRCQIKGQGEMEKKLIEKIHEDYLKAE